LKPEAPKSILKASPDHGDQAGPTLPGSPAVHGLLRYLEAAGFPGAPRVLGLDLPDSGWREGAAAPEGGKVICHNDVAHYNTVFRAGLVDTILRRVQAVCDLIVDQAAKGDAFFQQHLAEGHLDGYQRDLVFIESLRAPLQEALAAG
jgi:hypothetical protein